MFLVLIEYLDDGDLEWDVVAHGRNGLRKPFGTRAEADAYARQRAKLDGNRFAVVQIIATIQNNLTREVMVEETPVA